MHLVEVVRNKELVYVKEVPVARATRLIRECAVQDLALQVNAQINERNISLSLQAPSETWHWLVSKHRLFTSIWWKGWLWCDMTKMASCTINYLFELKIPSQFPKHKLFKAKWWFFAENERRLIDIVQLSHVRKTSVYINSSFSNERFNESIQCQSADSNYAEFVYWILGYIWHFANFELLS